MIGSRASPFASLGRPTFGFFSRILYLRYYRYPDRCLWRVNRGYLQDRDVACLSIALPCRVRPRVGVGGLWVAPQFKNFYLALPDRLTLKGFGHWYCFEVLRFAAV